MLHNLTSIFRNSNPKLVYKYINDKQLINKSIKALNINGKFITEPKEIADELNKFFQSVFTTDSFNFAENLNFKTNVKCDTQPEDLVSMEILINRLETLEPSKSPGPDGVHGQILKNTAKAISIPIFIIFTNSFRSGIVPNIWKQANITPLHKTGSKVKVDNYRPVSLTCILCKVFEGMIKDVMLKHLLDNNLLSKAQHGFLPSRSCVTNLLETIDLITFALASGYPVDIIYTDFSKSFDKISHKKLLTRLKQYGFDENIINWVREFLSGRSQRVVLGKNCSSWLSVFSGVPQGSVLGPLLFIIYINEMLEIIENDCKAYADDTKIIAIIKNFQSNLKLQNDMDKICQWSKNCSTVLNAEKCKVLHLGRTNTKFDYEIEKHTGGKQPLAKTTCEKDLGIFIKHDMKWDVQVRHSTA
ncbi:unnamed protein product, partial [Brachionus calyciflorus]